MNIADIKKINLEYGDKPDKLVNTESLFGIKSPFSVPGFSKKNDYVNCEGKCIDCLKCYDTQDKSKQIIEVIK